MEATVAILTVNKVIVIEEVKVKAKAKVIVIVEAKVTVIHRIVVKMIIIIII